MRVPLAVLTLTTMTILWVNSRSPERKNQQLWLDRLKQRGLESIGTGTLCHESQIRCWHRLWWVNSDCSRCCGFPGIHFALPGHFRLLTKHSLISEISGQGFPKGEGYRRTCRVRVSWPRLNPQVLPEREQGLHSLHSPTSQCTKLRKTKKNRFSFSVVHDFVASEQPSAQTDLEVCTPWVCHWARSHLGRRGGTSRSAGTGPDGTACTSHCSRRTRSLPGTLQRQPRWGASVYIRGAQIHFSRIWPGFLSCRAENTSSEESPQVKSLSTWQDRKTQTNQGHRGLHLGTPAKSNPNHALGFLKLTGSTFPLCFVADEPLGAGLLAFAQVKVESCSAPRAEVLGEAGVTLWPALLTKKNRPTAGVYLNHKLSSASCMLNIHRVTVLHVSLGIQLRVQIDVLYTDALDLI